jgi:hypothetical protein
MCIMHKFLGISITHVHPEDPGQSDDAEPVALIYFRTFDISENPGPFTLFLPLFLIFLFNKRFAEVASLKHFSRVPKCF